MYVRDQPTEKVLIIIYKSNILIHSKRYAMACSNSMLFVLSLRHKSKKKQKERKKTYRSKNIKHTDTGGSCIKQV